MPFKHFPLRSLGWAYVVATCVASNFAAPSRAATESETGGAASSRVLPAGQLPDDRRLGPLKNHNGYFPFTPPKTAEQWKARADEVRKHILVATGLWPMPERTPLNPVIHGKVEREGYTVERVYFESYPGHFVTGSLFRPVGHKGKLPGVLCPYGHWANGRFYKKSMAEVRQDIAAGAERFEVGGRYPLQARCVQLARMGCVVFHYDMVSVSDSQQLANVAHHPQPRPQLDTPENWGFYSTQAELRLQSIMGLQTYNSVRALDFLSELPDVDAKRIGVTGASGGGTQTFILGAIDDRPAVAVPAVMVSTGMQGGCTCENCCLLRIGMGNVDFAAAFAPRPLCLIGANDWTVEIATKGGPELQKLYSLLDAKDKVKISPHNQFGHNYNYVSREVMYQWMNQHLGLGLQVPVIEEDFKPLSIEELTVWDDQHPKPPSGDDYERSLVKTMTDDAERQLTRIVPKDEKSLGEFRKIVGTAWNTIIGRPLSQRGDVEFKQVGQTEVRAGYRELKGLLRNLSHREELPVVVLQPTGKILETVVWLDKTGKSGLFSDGKPTQAVEKLLNGGKQVVGIDLLYQGEFLADGKSIEKARLTSKRALPGVASFTFGYNSTIFAQRVHDVLTAVAYFTEPSADLGGKEAGKSVSLVGLNGSGHWAAVAKAIAGDAISRVAIDTAGFRFANVAGIDDPDFLPGTVKYFDLPGALALNAPGKLWIRQSPEKAQENTEKLIADAYQAANSAANLVVFNGPSDNSQRAAAEWLLEAEK